MMVIKSIIRKIFNSLKSIEEWADNSPKKTIKPKENQEGSKTVASVWSYLGVKENTQAAHLTAAVGFEEWVEMPEIKRRIKELFGQEYKNERSLYPYIKTMVDCSLFEFTDIGGKRKWKKKALLLKVPSEAKKQETATEKETEKSN